MLNLLFIIFLVLISFNLIYQVKDNKVFLNKIILFSGFTFFISVIILLFFDKSTAQPQYISPLLFESIKYPLINWDVSQTYQYHLQEYGIDGLSIFFVILTTFLIFFCFLDIWSEINSFFKLKEFIFYFLILEIFLFLAFITLDLLIFYIFFESVLIPMFLIIGIWGSRERKIRADFYFFLYTLVGSIFLFFSILILFFETYSTKFFILYGIFLPFEKECLLGLFSFIAFSVKMPTFPAHLWLPEAHVEAPTSGSVVLAGLLLKLGGYGAIRMILPIFPNAIQYYFPLIGIFCILSIVYASLTTIRQIDLKRIIAYSSVAHMNVVSIGIFTTNVYGIQGAIYLMLAHGIVSSALFFIIGVLYKKHSTRLLSYYGGLVTKMPLFSFYLLIFCLANIGTPGTCNFIGELVIFVSLVEKNLFLLILAASSVVLSVIYTMWFFNRVIFGNVKTNYIQNWNDIDKRENWLFGTFLFCTIIFGIFPNQIFDTTFVTSAYIIELIKFKTEFMLI